MGLMFGVAPLARMDVSSTVELKSEQTMPQAQVDSINIQAANDDAEPDTKAPKGTLQPATLQILVGVMQMLQAVVSSDLQRTS
jgi:response regulator of citrate/malate metabolism